MDEGLRLRQDFWGRCLNCKEGLFFLVNLWVEKLQWRVDQQ